MIGFDNVLWAQVEFNSVPFQADDDSTVKNNA